jgi:hypothetical protein
MTTPCRRCKSDTAVGFRCRRWLRDAALLDIRCSPHSPAPLCCSPNEGQPNFRVAPPALCCSFHKDYSNVRIVPPALCRLANKASSNVRSIGTTVSMIRCLLSLDMVRLDYLQYISVAVADFGGWHESCVGC